MTTDKELFVFLGNLFFIFSELSVHVINSLSVSLFEDLVSSCIN